MEQVGTLRLPNGERVQVYEDEKVRDWGTLVSQVEQPGSGLVELTVSPGGAKRKILTRDIENLWPAGRPEPDDL